MAVSAEAVANWLLDRAKAAAQPLDPMKLQKAVHADIVKMAKRFMETFGSAGRA